MPLSEKTQKKMIARDARVLKAIKSAKGGASMAQLKARTNLEANPLRGCIKRLWEAGEIKTEGASRGMRYFAA